MIANQRHLFDLPDDVAYFSCSSTSPLLKRALMEGQTGLTRKLRPWTIPAADAQGLVGRARTLVAALMGAKPDDVAVVPSAAYGTSTAAAVLPLKAGQEVVVCEGEFPALIYPFKRKAREVGASLRTVARPSDDDWTAAILGAIGPKTGVVAMCQVNWMDGSVADLVAIGKACRKVGAALVLDICQSLGAMAFSVEEIDPDVVAVVGEKWLFGPYGIGYTYVAPRWQNAAPIEEGWATRAHGLDPKMLTSYDETFGPGARRFDTDERFNYAMLPAAIAGLEQVHAWGVDNIATSLKPMVEAIATSAERHGLVATPAKVRARHILGLRPGRGSFPVDLVASLAKRGVHVAVRNDVMRIGPHLYNNERDVQALLGGLGELTRANAA